MILGIDDTLTGSINATLLYLFTIETGVFDDDIVRSRKMVSKRIENRWYLIKQGKSSENALLELIVKEMLHLEDEK